MMLSSNHTILTKLYVGNVYNCKGRKTDRDEFKVTVSLLF